MDVNLGCPIDYFTSKGLGAALAREPNRVRRIVEAMKKAVRVPVTVKIRLGWNDEHRNFLDVARAAVEGGADAITVHGRTRAARYTMSADWNAIAEVAATVPVPVIGNGDILFGHEVEPALQTSGCTAVMSARGALIKPWLFREVSEGELDLERGRSARRLSTLRRAREGALGRRRAWSRPDSRVPAVAPGVLVPLCAAAGRRDRSQRCSSASRGRRGRPLEALLARSDASAHAFLADALLTAAAIDPAAAPAPADAREIDDDAAEAG